MSILIVVVASMICLMMKYWWN